MKKAYLTTNICISAVSLIFFENIFRNFERKNLSTFSTLSTKLIFSKIIYIFVLIQSSTFFYKTPFLMVFSTFFYDFYTLITKPLLQIADNVHCRKTKACRKCRTEKYACWKHNFSSKTSRPESETHKYLCA